jgi:cytochrome c-type biogenesis protein CcmH
MLAFAANLRCLVCQNESLAASQADLAIDLKNQIREKMRAGESDDAILAYLVARYGDFVLYKPPFKATTLLLWAGPFALLVVGLIVLGMSIRRRAREADRPLNDAEQAHARSILAQADEP